MKFLVVMRQDGGCDYTIGCGIAVELVESNKTTRDAAVAEIIKRIVDEHTIAELDAITIYPVEDPIQVDLDEIQKKVTARQKAREREIIEAEERAQLARLKAKYGNP